MRDRLVLLAIVSGCLSLVGCGKPIEEDHLASAKREISKGEAKEASIHLKAALSINPSSAEARFLLGELFMTVGEPAAAAVELDKARQLKYPADQVTPALARAWLEAGQAKRVLDEFSGAALAAPAAAADLGTTLAAAMLASGDMPGARARIETVLASNPKFARALLTSAVLDALAGATERAMGKVAEAITVEPGSADAHVLRGRLLGSSKRPDEALRSFEAAVQAQPNFADAHTEIINHHLRLQNRAAAEKQFEVMRRVQPRHFQTLFFEAQFSGLRQELKKAQDLSRALLQRSPNNVPLLVLAGVTELQLGSLEQSEAHLNKAVLAAPQAEQPRLLLSQVLLRGGKAARALDVLKPLVESPKPSSQALAQAAEIHLQTGDARQADMMFSRALQVDPESAQLRTTVALAQLARGQRAQAVPVLESIAATDKGTIADLALISSHFRHRQYDAALQAIESLQKKQAGKPLSYALRGRVLALKNDVPGARASYERALALEANYLPAVSGLGALDVAANQPDAARQRLDAVLKASPNNLWASMSLAELKANSGSSSAIREEVANLLTQAQQSHPRDPTPSLRLIDYYLSNKQFAKATTLAEELASKMPDRPAVLESLGRTQAIAGERQRALTTFARLAAMQTSASGPHLRMAELQLSMENFDAAVQGFKRALELAPGSVQAERGLVAVAMRSKQPAKALAAARALRTQQGNGASGWVVEGDIEAWRKNWPAAVAAYAGALKLVPDDGAVAQRMYLSLTASGKLPDARRFAQDWVKSHPQHAEFLTFLGDTALSRGDLPDAEAHFKAALAIQPGHPSASNNIAWLLTQRGAKGAVAHAERAVASIPDNAVFLDTLALALAHEGQIDRALATAKRVTALAPNEPLFGLSLAKIQLQAGDKAGALIQLDKLAKLGPNFKRQAEVRELRTAAGG